MTTSQIVSPRTEQQAASKLRAAANAARPRRPGAAGIAVSTSNSPDDSSKTDKSAEGNEPPSVPLRQGSGGQAPVRSASPRTDVDLRIGRVKKSPSVAAPAEHSDVPARERTATRMGGRKAQNPKSNIVVRLPVEDDREAVRALARKLHNMTIFSDIEFSDAKFDKLFDRALIRPNHMSGLVAELTKEGKETPSVAAQAERSEAQARERMHTRTGGRKTGNKITSLAWRW